MAHPAPSPIYCLRGAGAPLNTLHFCCRGTDTPLLFSGSAKGMIHMWNLNSRRPEKSFEAHGGSSILWVRTLQSKDALISQGRDMQCSLIETDQTKSLLAFATQQSEEIKIVEIPSKTTVCTLVPEAKMGMVMCLKLWQPDSGPGPLLLAGYEDGSLLLWDVTQRSKLSQVKAHPEPVMCLTFDPQRLRGISGSAETKLSSWILDSQNNIQLQECVKLVNPGVSQLCIRADGKLLASAGWDHRVRIFGWKKVRPLAVLQYHSDMVLSVAFSDHLDPRQRLLAAGSKDQRISLWSIYNEGAATG
uniref:Guanine nucleotide binding protein (G protein), beta polypeptide 1-like n=1 Tax=Oryzias latipes TaxID=8090 RepID=A0A3P9HVH3_ORYLA